MRLAVLATTRNPLVEPFAGGQESMTAALITALRARGNHIRLYAAAGTPADLADEVLTYPDLPELSMVARLDPQVPEPDFLRDHHALMFAVSDLLSHTGSVDLIHNQTLHHLPLSLAPALPAPVLTTLHTPPFPWMELGAALAGPRSTFVAVSGHLARQWTTLDPPPAVIHNGIDPQTFRPGPGGEALVWVGRLVPEKGPQLAIGAARRAGVPLRLAGPVPDQEFYRDCIKPLLGAGIEHVGHLSHRETADLMGAGRALLMTPCWDEPFGLVAVEAALTGTPTLALDRGGLAEVMLPGMGALVDSNSPDIPAALAAVLPDVTTLPRDRVRSVAVEHFCTDHMTDAYEHLITRLASEESR